MVAVGDLRHLLLCRVEALVALADDAEALDHRDVLYAEEHQESGDCDRRRAAAVDDHLDLVHLAAGQAAGVEQRRAAADRRAVLVIMEYRNVADLLEAALDLEAARSGDVLKIDAAERAGDQLNRAHDLVNILGCNAERERIDIRERLEQRALALHDRHAGERADIAQTKHSRAVRDDRNEIVAARVFIAEGRIVLDLEARLGYAGRVGDGKIVLAVHLTAGNDLDLACPFFMCLECAFFYVHVLFLRYRSVFRRAEIHIYTYYNGRVRFRK